MNIFKSNKHLSVGERGERAAATYLKKCGYKILETNFLNPTGRRLGEIDIIAKDGEEIVFIEVKTRTNSCKNAPAPEESITHKKLHKLNKTASFYINKNRLFNSPFRFDAITLLANEEYGSAKLRHLKNVFL